MNLKYFLEYCVDDTLFLYYKEKFITRKDFFNLVNSFSDEISKLNITKGFVYINNQDILYFYVLLFSLWKNNIKVVFPNKLTIESGEIPIYCKYELKYNNDILTINENASYSEITIPINGDSVVFSSGSTGMPKGIVHNQDHFFINAISTLDFINIKSITSITFLKPYLVSALSHLLVHWFSKSLLIFEDYENIQNVNKYKKITNELNVMGSPMHIITSIRYLKKYSFIPKYMFSSGDMINTTIINDIIDSFKNIVFFKVYGLAELAGRFYIKNN